MHVVQRKAGLGEHTWAQRKWAGVRGLPYLLAKAGPAGQCQHGLRWAKHPSTQFLHMKHSVPTFESTLLYSPHVVKIELL